MKGRPRFPNDPKLSSVSVLAHSELLIRSSPIDESQLNFRIIAIAHTRLLFPYYSVFRADARGYMLFYSIC